MRTYLDDRLIDTTTDRTFAAGGFGFRTGNSESFVVDDVVMTDVDGEVVYAGDFADATDAAGSTSAVRALTVRVDSVAPTTTATPAQGFTGTVATGAGTVRFTATDATSGVAEIRHRVDGGEWATGDAVELTEAGEHRIEYYSTDVAGNAEQVQTLDVTVLHRGVSVEADTRCVVGRVVETVRVTNESAGSLSVTVAGAHGSRTVTLDPERTTAVAFSTRLASVPAGEVTATVTGGAAVTAGYAARACG